MRSILATAILGCGLVACATTDESDVNPLDDPRVGEKVDRICFASGISGFSEWDGANGLILRRGVRDRYAVTFIGSCFTADDALSIALNDRRSGGCLTRGDRIFVSSSVFPSSSDTPFDSDRCTVGAIYKWNKDAVENDADAENSDTTTAE